MRRPTLLALFVLALLGGCGGDDDGGGEADSTQPSPTAAYAEAYRPLDAAFRPLAQEIVSTIGAGQGKSAEEFEADMRSLSSKVAAYKRRLDALKPPQQLAAPHERFSKALAGAKRDLDSIAAAARQKDEPLVRSRVAELLAGATEVQAAEGALSQAAGAG